MATADCDADGDVDVDVAVGQLGQRQLLLANTAPSSGNWLELRLVGQESARDACGAIVRITADDEKQLRQVSCRTGSKDVHVGLGETNLADVAIDWPSGRTQTLDGIEANELRLVREPRRQGAG